MGGHREDVHLCCQVKTSQLKMMLFFPFSNEKLYHPQVHEPTYLKPFKDSKMYNVRSKRYQLIFLRFQLNKVLETEAFQLNS